VIQTVRTVVLADPPHLRLVFVGTAASTRLAAVEYYYAHPDNRFWRAIHEAGITPRRVCEVALARNRLKAHIIEAALLSALFATALTT
jgi:G:T/U-mismatch repair DNA glycosylase